MFLKAISRRRRKPVGTPVYLNVYDITPINGYAYWVGLGVYHSGIQVYDVEYAYGADESQISGIFEVVPMKCPGFRYRKSILIGTTELGPQQVRLLMDSMAEEYVGSSYHLFSKNCNHFCKDLAVRLTGKSIPRWVNRLANIGLFCNCILPENTQLLERIAEEDKEKGRVLIRGEKTIKEEEVKVKIRMKSTRYRTRRTPPPPSALLDSSSSGEHKPSTSLQRRKNKDRRTHSSSSFYSNCSWLTGACSSSIFSACAIGF